jgi:glycine betaine catabolism B
MSEQTIATTFVEKIPRSPGTASFRFVRPSGYAFTAGQWFILTVPSAAGPLTKHFTHSRSPTEGFLEFTTRLTGSEYKQAVEALSPGSEVQIEGPYGAFILKEEAARVSFLTGGIGITPVRSILRDLADSVRLGRPGAGARSLPNISVFYGNTNEDSITFGDELSAISDAHEGNPRLVHVLSDPSDGWHGYRGYIRKEVLQAELVDIGSWTYYVSGPPAMVEVMRVMLSELGVTRRQMVLENFEGYQ